MSPVLALHAKAVSLRTTRGRTHTADNLQQVMMVGRMAQTRESSVFEKLLTDQKQALHVLR